VSIRDPASEHIGRGEKRENDEGGTASAAPLITACDAIAKTRSKVNPAYAHSRSVGRPGARMPTTPSSLATPSSLRKYAGYPSCRSASIIGRGPMR
jgi:hypothetical protein